MLGQWVGIGYRWVDRQVSGQVGGHLVSGSGSGCAVGVGEGGGKEAVSTDLLVSCRTPDTHGGFLALELSTGVTSTESWDTG